MEYYDLGTYTRPVTTSAPEAQRWFDRGLIWAYGFNHEEAVQCFEQALGRDPDCAMAHWGIGYAVGPNYNKPWAAFDEADLRASTERAVAASSRAGQVAAGGTPAERALIGALRWRYAQDEMPGEREAWNQRYAEAMGRVYEAFADDPDVAALYADALMNLTPWQLWDLRTGEPAEGAQTVRAQAVLDRALRSPGGRAHPGILHMYIHLMEMSPYPERARPAAERLRGLVPDARAAVPASRTIFNNPCTDILAIAAAMLDGELEYRKGNIEAAFARLRDSIALDDGLPYDEPWSWTQPTRHAYGALLLEQDRVAEAEAVYRADLGFDDTLPRACQNPGNVWSLHGYHECLVRLGKPGEAAIIEQQLRFAAALADTPVPSSCFCRLNPDPGHA